MKDVRELMERLSDIKSKVPLLILGSSSTLFKNNYNGKIYNLQEVSEYIGNGLIVIDLDINYDRLLLLDVIAKTKNVVFLKKCDDLCVNDILMFNYIIKEDIISSCDMLNTQQALDKLKTFEEDIDLEKFYLDFSPSLKYNRRKVSKATSQAKIVSLLGGLE